MNEPHLSAVHRLTAGAGLGPVEQLVPLAGGANNRVYRVQTARGVAVLKAYFQHPDDARDRLGAEFAFSRFAWTAGVRSVPEPLACDRANALALFEFVEGRRPTTEDVTDSLVRQAVEFVRTLNAARWQPRAALLPVGSEACFSLVEHLGTVACRVDRLTQTTDPEASEFVRSELLPAWHQVRARCESQAAEHGLPAANPLDPTSRCVSPSDFGFHNTILRADGRALFHDFEYAGWDDPAKLVCDFFCQPAVPVPSRHFEPFARAVADCFADAERVLLRARVLLPVYRLKWVCIRLNEFLPVGIRRRAFSLPADGLADRRRRQLVSAQAALNNRERVAA
jgi:hypothetical protein